LTRDDAEKAAAAISLFENDSVWIAKTVLLETAWVLRSLYGLEDSNLQGIREVDRAQDRAYGGPAGHPESLSFL
jgi:hypothetical protein